MSDGIPGDDMKTEALILKPCPHCGLDDIETRPLPGVISITYIACNQCGAMTSFQGSENEQGACESWNRRAITHSTITVQ